MDRLQEILACVVRVLLNEEIIVKSKIFPQIAFFEYGKSMKRGLQEPTKQLCKKRVKCGILELRNRYPPELLFLWQNKNTWIMLIFLFHYLSTFDKKLNKLKL